MRATERHIRAAIREGNRKLRLRKELRALDDRALTKRLGKYLGFTSAETAHKHRLLYGGGLDRDRVIERIVDVEA